MAAVTISSDFGAQKIKYEVGCGTKSGLIKTKRNITSSDCYSYLMGTFSEEVVNVLITRYSQGRYLSHVCNLTLMWQRILRGM